jgi:putative addiction module component (TIGR02574 family)
MSSEAAKLLETALKMSSTERASIAQALLSSLEDEPDNNVELEWQKEIQKRLREIDSGKIILIPWEEAREKLRASRRASH